MVYERKKRTDRAHQMRENPPVGQNALNVLKSNPQRRTLLLQRVIRLNARKEDVGLPLVKPAFSSNPTGGRAGVLGEEEEGDDAGCNSACAVEEEDTVCGRRGSVEEGGGRREKEEKGETGEKGEKQRTIANL